jgi:hypothetical protein
MVAVFARPAIVASPALAYGKAAYLIPAQLAASKQQRVRTNACRLPARCRGILARARTQVLVGLEPRRGGGAHPGHRAAV